MGPSSGYDGGDCCKGSCSDAANVCGDNGFDCADPDFLGDYYPYKSGYTCEDDLVGNGECDYENNVKECGTA